MRPLVFILLSCMLSISCKNKSGLTKKQLKRVYISMETTACFGTCPIMTMELNGNGHVNLHARRFIDSLGLFERQLSKESLYNIVKNATTVDWKGLENEYLTGYTDLPSRIITYSPAKGDTFKVRFEEGAAPEHLEGLGKLLFYESDFVKHKWTRIEQLY